MIVLVRNHCAIACGCPVVYDVVEDNGAGFENRRVDFARIDNRIALQTHIGAFVDIESDAEAKRRGEPSRPISKAAESVREAG
jgi:hypothetical protein